MTDHKFKNVHEALARAQQLMGPVFKEKTNPHFRSTYADLSSVYAVAIPALNECDCCLTSEIVKLDGEFFMTTVITHGHSGTTVRCMIPIIVSKNDMQGFKSATTYAKRIGAESVCGLAPEDDDGNDAASSAPKRQARTYVKRQDTGLQK